MSKIVTYRLGWDIFDGVAVTVKDIYYLFGSSPVLFRDSDGHEIWESWGGVKKGFSKADLDALLDREIIDIGVDDSIEIPYVAITVK